MATSTITPYLFLGGKCEEALDYYRQTLDAEVAMVMRFSDSPDPTPPGMLQEGFESKIMHSEVRIGGAPLYLSDGCNDQAICSGFKLSLTFPTESQAEQVFARLAEGGAVSMPIGKTFWSSCFGMVTDQFGIEWMVTVPHELA